MGCIACGGSFGGPFGPPCDCPPEPQQPDHVLDIFPGEKRRVLVELIVHEKPNNDVTISRSEYLALLNNQNFLMRLYAHGVKEWAGYEVVLQEQELSQ